MLTVVLAVMTAIAAVAAGRIDRKALIGRNCPVVTAVDTLSSLSVGNGHFAFTTDVTGLQTFPEYYAHGVPLGTQSEWGWHRFDNPEGYRIEESYKMFDFGHGHRELYATEFKEQGRARDAANWYRQNPHRLHLGCIGLEEEGLTPTDIRKPRQTLDLWSGIIRSSFYIGRQPYSVTTVCHPDHDLIGIQVKGSHPAVNLRFPYPTGKHTDDACDWQADDRHQTLLVSQTAQSAVLRRVIDQTEYYVSLSWEDSARLTEKRSNYWVLEADGNQLTVTCWFIPQPPLQPTTHPNPSRGEGGENEPPITLTPLPSGGAGGGFFQETLAASTAYWQDFWTTGAAVDFSHCKDKRARELERRVVLSQYLLAIQCAGNMPPQETGLTYNSWFGKFHLEMIWWHQAWQPLWGHPEMLDRTLRWYETVEGKAREIAMRQGFKGVRWMKMTDPSGEESPSKVGSFLIWQQPHLIYLAELLYRSLPDNQRADVLNRYGRLIDETATFMADFATPVPSEVNHPQPLLSKEGGDSSPLERLGEVSYILRGMIPAQETLKAQVTFNSPFELAYWHFALGIAQQWRERRGLPRDPLWDDVIQHLAPLAASPDGLYLAAESAPDTYQTPALISDHPAVLGAVGIFPQSRLVDAALMRQTLAWILDNWNWDHTWGWDYPMVAMNATRLGEPEKAVDALLMPKRTNTYLPNGHNYQDQRLRCYLPGNGGLLTAIALMCAGWDGCTVQNPGFPKDGQWDVRWEGLQPLP